MDSDDTDTTTTVALKQDRVQTPKTDIEEAERPKRRRCPSHAARAYVIQRQEAESHGYALGHFIGEGSSAVVRMAEMLPQKLKVPRMAKYAERKNHTAVAIKIIDIRNAPKEYVETYISRELQIHRGLPVHDHVVQYLESFKTDNFLYIVSDLGQCDVLSKINFGDEENIQRGLPEEKAKRYFRQVCRAVLHLHRYNFAHRDLKLENLLIDENDAIKLSDFGFGIGVKDNTFLKIPCGSYVYASPEVLTNKVYDAKIADIWSLGIILYSMVNGGVPFDDDRIPVMEDLMKKQKFTFTKPVSMEYRDLIYKILQHDTNSRPTISQILRHPWLAVRPSYSKTRSAPNLNKDAKAVKFPYIYNDKYTPVPSLATKTRLCMATVMVQHNQKETVTLRSRAQGKRNNFVMATSPIIRGGRPSVFNTSRLSHAPPKKATPEPDATLGDHVPPVPKSPVKKDAAIGKTKNEDIIEIVQRVNSPEAEQCTEKAMPNPGPDDLISHEPHPPTEPNSGSRASSRHRSRRRVSGGRLTRVQFSENNRSIKEKLNEYEKTIRESPTRGYNSFVARRYLLKVCTPTIQEVCVTGHASPVCHHQTESRVGSPQKRRSTPFQVPLSNAHVPHPPETAPPDKKPQGTKARAIISTPKEPEDVDASPKKTTAPTDQVSKMIQNSPQGGRVLRSTQCSLSTSPTMVRPIHSVRPRVEMGIKLISPAATPTTEQLIQCRQQRQRQMPSLCDPLQIMSKPKTTRNAAAVQWPCLDLRVKTAKVSLRSATRQH